ncbi:Putative deoxyribonuclease YcfH [Mucinivorans hirudinis]|uniref:Putative deoxyribonuclease YcfH n=1 Tax=Mucinivorans hirudinis TaxID=1433126 RepID=A0A060R7U2_9BACT|nr:Putative deoxyribonuclease YcfH [Mucinivorans hirudinis]
MFINLHTHSPAREGVLSIESHDFFDGTTPNGSYSLGVYPFAAKPFDKELFVSRAEKSVMIGETGLDYRPQYRENREWQIQVFAQQIEIANALSKPIIVHQVKALDDCLEMLSGALTNVAFHGFSSSLQSAERIVSRGYYLSFGHLLLTNERLQGVIRALPLDKIFFETDACVNIRIEDVYGKAAELLGVKLSVLERQIESNFSIYA